MPFHDVLPFVMPFKSAQSKASPDPIDFGESLQDYAARSGRTIPQAYAQWHKLGGSLGLTVSDVKALAAGRY